MIQKVKITLKYPHEHENVLHPAGKAIEVWPDQAERIRATEAKRERLEREASKPAAADRAE